MEYCFFIVSCGIDKSANQERKDANIVKQIKEHNLENLIIPHRINSLNRLRKVQKMGFSSWELDLRFYIEEEKLNRKIVYHTWDMSLSLDDRLVIEKYLVQPYAKDKLIKTVLIPIK